MANTYKLVVQRPAKNRTITITSWYDSEANAAAAAAKTLVGETWTISSKDGSNVITGAGNAEKDPNAAHAPTSDPRAARRAAMMKGMAGRKAADAALAAQEAAGIKAQEAHQHAAHVAAEEAAAHPAAPTGPAEPASPAPAATGPTA
jgi:hypothetical protein